LEAIEKMKELEDEVVVELTDRLETTTAFSPITSTVTMNSLALNALNLAGAQTAVSTNAAMVSITTS
jgi:hypothetical protein